jgi:hypothetical protein
MQMNDQQQPSQAQNLLLILRFQIALRTLANRRVMPTLIWRRFIIYDSLLFKIHF